MTVGIVLWVLALGGKAAQRQHRTSDTKLSFRMKWNGMRNHIIANATTTVDYHALSGQKPLSA